MGNSSPAGELATKPQDFTFQGGQRGKATVFSLLSFVILFGKEKTPREFHYNSFARTDTPFATREGKVLNILAFQLP